MATFFIADTHFSHAGARGFYRRPFASTAAMDAAMEEYWCATVAPDDDVYHLGDFAITHKDPAALLGRLPGRKHLVPGNNDPPAIRALPGWASVADYREITVDGQALVLCHYAFRTWNGMGRGAWNLHGHSHGRLEPLRHQADLGVDVWGYHPVTFDTVRKSRLGSRSTPA